MRKLFAMLLACLLMASCTLALADEGFTLRNGVMFGDTMEDVRAKETLECHEDTEECMLYTEDGTVGGFSDVTVKYYFDEDTKLLKEVNWRLPVRHDVDASDSDYSQLYSALVDKYGDPHESPDGSLFCIHGTTIFQAMFDVKLYQSWQGKDSAGIRDAHEWVVNIGDGNYVKIEMVQHYAFISSRPYIKIDLGYSPFTEQELQDKLQELQKESDALMNDI